MSNVQDDISDGEVGPWICFFIIIAFNVIAYFINERNIFRCCCRCNRGACLLITNRAAGVSRRERPKTFFAWDLLDARHLAAGERTPALLMLVYRSLSVVVFVFTTLWQQFGVRKLRTKLKSDYLEFFTNWTFVGFGLCNLLGAAISFGAVRNGETYASWNSPSPHPQRYTFLHKAFHFVYTAVTPTSGALSLFYWALLYDGRQIAVDNVIKHGGSFLLLSLDLLLSRIPMVTYHAAMPIWYTSAYTVFLWVYYDIDGTWVYKALDWTTPLKTVNYFAMVVLLLLALLFMYALAGLRELLITGKCCCTLGCCRCCGDCCVPKPENEEFVADVTVPMYKAPNSHQFMTSS